MIQNRTPVEDRPQQSAPSGSEARPSASSRCSRFVEKNPTTAVFLGFGAGLGAGVILACLLRESTSYFRHEDSLAERIGSRVRESVQDMLPSSWKKRLGS